MRELLQSIGMARTSALPAPLRRHRYLAELELTFAQLAMQNDAGQVVDLYVLRKCASAMRTRSGR